MTSIMTELLNRIQKCNAKKENFHEVLIVFEIVFINLEKSSHYLLQLTETTKERSSLESKI